MDAEKHAPDRTPRQIIRRKSGDFRYKLPLRTVANPEDIAGEMAWIREVLRR
jgi:hypothetical protein